MSYQLRTEININESDKIFDYYIVGRVYFAYNSDQLDEQDKRQILKLKKLYRSVLKNVSIEFTCIGATDYRGIAEYNLKLGRKRAISVLKHLRTLFKDFPKCHIANIYVRIPNVTDSISIGEIDAYKPRKGYKPSKEGMALDRCAYILANRIPNRMVFLPPIALSPPTDVQKVKRIITKVFEHSNNQWDLEKQMEPPKIGDAIQAIGEESVKAVLTEINDYYYPVVKPFEEDSFRRKTKLYPDYYDINSIYVKIEKESDIWGTRIIIEVTYNWVYPFDDNYVRIYEEEYDFEGKLRKAINRKVDRVNLEDLSVQDKLKNRLNEYNPFK